MTKEERALEAIDRLKKEYPDAECSLEYDPKEAWRLLVSVRLAAQCTDARVNVVVKELYARFPDVNALAQAEPEEIEAIVRPCGLGKSKARDISACMKILRDQYDGMVPDDFDALLKLPGVGRKSANRSWEMSLENPPLSQTHTVFVWLTGWGWWKTSRTPKKWRWRCGSLSRRKRATASVTVWSSTGGKSVRPGQSRTVTAAVWRTSVKKMGFRENCSLNGIAGRMQMAYD